MIEINLKLTQKQEEVAKYLSDNSKKNYMFYGGSRSGKTYLSCIFIRVRALLFPGSRHLVARYSFANAKKTVWLQTLLPLLKEDEKSGLCKINKTEGICHYNNGSTIMLGGLEPARIDKILGGEYGTIFVTEVNENKFEDIEKLFSRLNDIAANEKGNRIPLKFICDLNPTVTYHWTHTLFLKGLDPVSGESKNNFNEFLAVHFRPEDNIENLSKSYIESLKNLSPNQRKRFYEGEFGSSEGLVFKVDESVHIIDDFPLPEDWQRGRAIDFGYTHPFVCLWAAFDKSNETIYVYMEYSKTKTTVKKHAEAIKKLSGDEKISFTVADHDAEDRATLSENGINTTKANKKVLAGIDRMCELFHFDENKKPNIKIFLSCSNLISELYNYRWSEPATRLAKDREVVKENDDHVDALRYLVMKFFPIGNKGVYAILKKDNVPYNHGSEKSIVIDKTEGKIIQEVKLKMKRSNWAINTESLDKALMVLGVELSEEGKRRILGGDRTIVKLN